MIRSKLMLAARFLIVDQRTNNVSAINILEELKPAAFPAVFPEVAVLVVLERDSGDPLDITLTLRVRILDTTLLERGFPMRFEEGKQMRSTFFLEGMPVTAPGIVVFSAVLDNEELDRYTISITSDKVETIIETSKDNGNEADDSGEE